MDTIARKLLEGDEVDSLHPGAAVEALTVALNRDIGMEIVPPSISKPPDLPSTLGASVTDGSSTSNQLISEWQASSHEDHTTHRIQQAEELKDLQAREQHSPLLEQPKQPQNVQHQQQVDSHSENENLNVQQENLSTDQYWLPKDQVVENNLIPVSQENSVHESQQDKLQHSEDQQESLSQQLNDQQASTSDQANNQMRRMKSRCIPFGVLISILRPNLDKDRNMHLEALFAKLRTNEITREVCLRAIRNIVDVRILRQAAQKVLQMVAHSSQIGSSQHQLQASQRQISRSAQQFVEGQLISQVHSLSSMQHQRGQISTNVQQVVEESTGMEAQPLISPPSVVSEPMEAVNSSSMPEDRVTLEVELGQSASLVTLRGATNGTSLELAHPEYTMEVPGSFLSLGIEWPDAPQICPFVGEGTAAMLIADLQSFLHREPLPSIEAMRRELESHTKAYHMLGLPKEPWMTAMESLWSEYSYLHATQEWKANALVQIQRLEEEIATLEDGIRGTSAKIKTTRDHGAILAEAHIRKLVRAAELRREELELLMSSQKDAEGMRQTQEEVKVLAQEAIHLHDKISSKRAIIEELKRNEPRRL